MQMKYFSMSLVLVINTAKNVCTSKWGKISNFVNNFISGCGLGGSAASVVFHLRARCILVDGVRVKCIYCIITAMTKVTVFAVVLVVFIYQFTVGGML